MTRLNSPIIRPFYNSLAYKKKQTAFAEIWCIFIFSSFMAFAVQSDQKDSYSGVTEVLKSIWSGLNPFTDDNDESLILILK